MPFFSIIVPVYNNEKYLDKCFSSVLNQSFKDFELILVDDGSTDSSYSKCLQYKKKDSRVKVFHIKNSGASGARNKGLSQASGEYCMFLDSDDFYNSEEVFLTLKNKIDKTGSDIVVFGCTDWNQVTGETVVSRTGYNYDIIDRNIYSQTFSYLLSNKMIPGSSTIFTFRLKVAKQNNIKFKVGVADEDYDYVLSIFYYAKSISAIDNPYYTYRLANSHSVTATSSIKMIYGIDYTIKKWYEICKNICDENLKKEILNYLAFIFTTGFVITGRMNKTNRKESIKILKKNKFILDYGYWKKTKIIKFSSILFGYNLFSKLSVIYFNKTHIG